MKGSVNIIISSFSTAVLSDEVPGIWLTFNVKIFSAYLNYYSCTYK